MIEFQHFKVYLSNISFLTEDDCSLFEPFLKTRTIKAKDQFLINGSICREIGFVNEGAFRMYYLTDGKEINVQFNFENSFVTDYDSFLRAAPSYYSIQALEDSEVVTFNLVALRNAYQLSKNWERFGRLIAEQAFMQTSRRVESFLFMNGEQRYLNLLRYDPVILERVPLYHIASYLGLERESLSRLRKKLAGK